MYFNKKSINAIGRNKYGAYIGYRKPKTTACEDGVWVLRTISLAYSDGSNAVKADGSNYATIQGTFDFIVDVDFTADTQTFVMTPQTPANPHSVYYKFSGNKIYWNDVDFGTTTASTTVYNNLYGSFQGVNYTGNTVSLRTGANAITSVSSEIDYFTTNHGDTEITVGSGETTVFFVAQATRTITFTTTKTLTETVTELASEGDGKLYIDSNMGSAVDDSVDISANYSQSAITGWVVVYDDLDSTATSSVTVTQEGKPAAPDYLAMDIVSGGTIVWLSTSVATEHRKTIEYSKDNGETWSSITSNQYGNYFNVATGDKVVFRGNNVDYYYATFSGSTAIYNLSGNICSLLSSTNFDTITALTSNNTFSQIFRDTNVVDASNLKLPAKVLSEGCYRYMFTYCHSLTAAPALPATALTQGCYFGMFVGCTSLTTAPVLSAATLVQQCYKWMFSGCTSLNYVKCLATNISASECTNNWLADVAASGTFEKAPNMSSWTSGASGIPTGWTVIGDNKVFVTFTEGTYNSTTINDYELEWNIYEGNEPVGAVLYSGNGPDEVPAHQYAVYNWGLDTNAGTAFTYEIPSSEWGTTKTYYFELAVLDYYSGNVLQVNTGTFTATIPASPSGTVTVNAALPDIP